ncbi:MarR family EPS-associated transcriptional regulator [Paucibacter sp. M5-1]|uniref:MarR family EPS-associated transcriptional regulator n=1 Tax=Paucibacter sp. M5-1 TaxID=3015998 RepID=UPI003F80301C
MSSTASPHAPTEPPDPDVDDARLMVLRALEQDPHISQRALSSRLGISLGKTHYLLQALLSKGLVKMRNFERSDRKLAYSYLLTPAGLVEKARITRDFLQRKEAEFEVLRRAIDELHDELNRTQPVEADPTPPQKS